MYTFSLINKDYEFFKNSLSVGILGKANDKVFNILHTNIIEYSGQQIDDSPFGGGAGMVLKPDVIDSAIKRSQSNFGVFPIVYPSPDGEVFNRDIAQELAALPGISILSGYYEGIDARVLQAYNIRKISIGDYILPNGDIAALVMISAIARLLHGTLGNIASTYNESFEGYLLSCDCYTRPRVWNNIHIPDILISGNHKDIENYKKQEASKKTMLCRPDLWIKHLIESI